jgi:hypothetical protein
MQILLKIEPKIDTKCLQEINDFLQRQSIKRSIEMKFKLRQGFEQRCARAIVSDARSSNSGWSAFSLGLNTTILTSFKADSLSVIIGLTSCQSNPPFPTQEAGARSK